MPIKRVKYPRVRFDVAALQAARAAFAEECAALYRESVFGADLKAQARSNLDSTYGQPTKVEVPTDLIGFGDATVSRGETTWTFDSLDEFYAEIRGAYDSASVEFSVQSEYRQAHGETFMWTFAWRIEISIDGGDSVITVTAGGRTRVEKLMGIFDDARGRCAVSADLVPAVKPRIFIGHGHSGQWRLLADHLRDLHGYDVEAFESGSRAGHTVRDILDGLLESTDVALLVMTAEDVQKGGELRARQNVVHEAGLFQGRLGFPRAVILLEEGTEEFSNVNGVQYIGFGPENIRETFGDVLALLRREFGE
jgi:hypothetical protein